MPSLEKDCKYLWHCIEGASLFSTCSKRQYMAVIVDESGHNVGTGYNGVPRGLKHCSDGGCPRANQQGTDRNNYDNCYAIHAEANAILHSDYTARRNCVLYVNGVPCFGCAKLIANAGIIEVVYVMDIEPEHARPSLDLLRKCNIQTTKLTHNELLVWRDMRK